MRLCFGSMSVLPLLVSLIVFIHFGRSQNDAIKITDRDGGTIFRENFQTEETVRRNKARDIQRYMNLSADPCEDFYEYACGNWETSQTNAQIITPHTQLKDRIDNDMIHLLEKPINSEDSPLANQAKEFYRSCLNAQARQSQPQQLFLSEFIQQNGGFPAVPGSNWIVHHHNYDWVQVLGKLRHYFNMDILIGLRVSYNYANVHENSIYLDEPSTFIPPHLCNAVAAKQIDVRDVEYEVIEAQVASQLKAWLALGNDESKQVAADIVTFEYELCGSMQGLNEDLFLYNMNYTRKTLAEFTRLYGHKLDFEGYVRASYGENVYRPVYMAAPKYYTQLLRTIDAFNSNQLANYVMYRALASLTFPLDDQQQRRPSYCLEKIKQYLPKTLGELYARKYANEETKNQLLDMFKQLKDAFKISLQAKWLEEGTQRLGERKLNDLKLMISAYERPSAYNMQLDSSNYWHNLRKLLSQVRAQEEARLFESSLPQPNDAVEAYELRICYRPVHKRLDIGWALLQPPEYDSRYGSAVFYATVGQDLAEQLVMAFDDQHWSVRLLEIDNWDYLTELRYRNRSDCFNRQVTDYMRPNVTAAKHLIRRSSALNVAFRAYLNWLSFQEPHNEFARLTKETLPGLNISNTALFFIAYAQLNCRRERQAEDGEDEKRNALMYSARQKHSWIRNKVNGPLRNLAEFAREFHCLAGVPMNPPDKCVIY